MYTYVCVYIYIIMYTPRRVIAHPPSHDPRFGVEAWGWRVEKTFAMHKKLKNC